MGTLRRAFLFNENNSLLLLSRSKQTLHALTTQVAKDISVELSKEGSIDENQVVLKQQLKVIRVNSTLNNSEPKILLKLCETLGLKHESKSFYTVEMI